MYEKHIERLRGMLDATGVEDENDASLTAAIALMCAAEPEDEAAEREHCRKALLEQNRAWLFDATMNQEQRNAVTEWLMRERAAARAEGYAAGRSEHHDDWQPELDRLQAELAEARAALRTMSANEGKLQARIAETELALTRVRGVLAADHEQFRRSQAVINELQTKLATANARIAELETLGSDLQGRITDLISDGVGLQTTLTDLREAAERAEKFILDHGLNTNLADALRTAIEASKK